MGRYSGKTCRLLTMLMMTGGFFLVEIVVGYITNSIALVADSFHMLSDVVALIVGFSSVRIAKWPTKRNTFGWARAEVLGALVNSVFLLALCFSIFVEALKRLVEVEEVDDPKLLLIVGSAGLLINIIGIGLFHQHGHAHGGHGHSHGPSSESEALVHNVRVSANGEVSTDLDCDSPENSRMARKSAPSSSAQLNMRGVFLHVLGDALGSVIVIISALVIWFVEADWKYYVDPAMSIGLVIILLGTTIPLFRESALILMQTVPGHIHMGYLKSKLEEVEGVIAIHEFHVWQLAGSRIIASAHVRCQNIQEYVTIATKIKELLHNEGIHSTTIQPECEELYTNTKSPLPSNGLPSNSTCYLECGPNMTCHKDTCCGRTNTTTKNRQRSRQRKLPYDLANPEQRGPILDSNERGQEESESLSSDVVVEISETDASPEETAVNLPMEKLPQQTGVPVAPSVDVGGKPVADGRPETPPSNSPSPPHGEGAALITPKSQGQDKAANCSYGDGQASEESSPSPQADAAEAATVGKD